MFGIRDGRDVEMRMERTLEFRLSGLVISPVGEVTKCSTTLPSGMVGGGIVSLLKMLSALSVMALSIVGESGGEPKSSSRMCDVMNSDVRELGSWADVLSIIAASVWIVGSHFFSVFSFIDCWLEV